MVPKRDLRLPTLRFEGAVGACPLDVVEVSERCNKALMDLVKRERLDSCGFCGGDSTLGGAVVTLCVEDALMSNSSDGLGS